MNTDDRAELALREAAQRLGMKAAEAIDVERTVQGVLERLRTEPRVRRWWSARPTVLRLAAAIALVVAGALLVLRNRGSDIAPVNDVAAVSSDLGELSAGQLEELLASIDEALKASAADVDDGLESLTEEQLRTLMQSLEG